MRANYQFDGSVRRQPDAFSLIELLVVITVLSLLLTIILPGLKNARLIGRQLVCGSQMKQWAMLVHLYANDNDQTIVPYATTCDLTGNALDRRTCWYNRLGTYVAEHGTDVEYSTNWGFFNARKCPMGKGAWGQEAVWTGVYFGAFNTKHSPFVFLNRIEGSTIVKKAELVKMDYIRSPSSFLMMLDVQRDHTFNPFDYQWQFDVDGDGMNDSYQTGERQYNWAQPKIHRNGCNVALFDGHVEYINYKDFWAIGDNGYPVHTYWYNGWRP